MRIGEGLETIGAMTLDLRSVRLGVKRELEEGVVVATVKYEDETCGMRMEKCNKLVVT